jgi:hypothetical protein
MKGAQELYGNLKQVLLAYLCRTGYTLPRQTTLFHSGSHRQTPEHMMRIRAKRTSQDVTVGVMITGNTIHNK